MCVVFSLDLSIIRVKSLARTASQMAQWRNGAMAQWRNGARVTQSDE